MPEYPDPESRNVIEPGCARCPALVDCRNEISWGTGPGDADVFVVGEAPGTGDPKRERWRGGNWTGMAYTSAHSGRRIRDILASAGHPDAYYTNAVKCLPGDGDGGNREPEPAELAACRTHLETELESIDPAVVVPTGRHATETLLAFDDRSLDGFLEVVLGELHVDAIDPVVVPILHPSYQDVWIARLGYEPDEYEDALAARLNAHVDANESS